MDGNTSNARQDDPLLVELFSALQETEDYSEANDLAARIGKIWSSSSDEAIDTMMSQGSQYFKQGEFSNAIAVFTAIIQIDLTFSEAWNKRAVTNFLYDDHVSAMEDISHVLELEPRHYGVLMGLRIILEIREQDDAAISAYEKVLVLNPYMAKVKDWLRKLKDRKQKKDI